MLNERALIVVFVILTIIIPIFIGIMISRAWAENEVDKYLDNIINQTNQESIPKDLYMGNFTDERGNNFEGNNFGEQSNNTPPKLPICWLIDMPDENLVNQKYWCHSA